MALTASINDACPKEALAAFIKSNTKQKKRSKKGEDDDVPKGSALARLERVTDYIKQKQAVIDISNLNIGNLGASWLALHLQNHNKLKELHLPNCGIGDEGVECLANSLGMISGLVVLRLQSNKIEVAGAKALAKGIHRHRLTFLELSNNKIGDEGVLVLAETLKLHKNLTWLGFDNNEITDVGAAALAEAVGKHEKLYWFGMDGNMVSDTGSAKLSMSLGKHKDLNFLWLSNNLIGDSGATRLAEDVGSHKELRWLGLEGNDDILKAGTSRLAELVPPRAGIEWIQLKGRIRDPDWRPPPRKDVDMLELLAAERPPHLRRPKRVVPDDVVAPEDAATADVVPQAVAPEGASLDDALPESRGLAGFAAGEAVRADVAD